MANILNIPHIYDSPILHDCHRWDTRKFLSIFDTPENNELWINPGIQKFKTLDFLVVPGKVSCKVQIANTPPTKIEIIFDEIEPTTWEKIISTLANNLYYVSKLYIEEIPEEILDIFDKHNTYFVSRGLDDMHIFHNNIETKKLNLPIVVMLKKLVERFEAEPFLIFMLRGCGRDELISGIRRYRGALQKTQCKKLKEQAQNVEIKINGFAKKSEVEQTQEQIEQFLENVKESNGLIPQQSPEHYWKWGEDIAKLKYTIKADDLPASILKRLDQLPIGVLENNVSYILEEAYAHITRRAQSFGLGL